MSRRTVSILVLAAAFLLVLWAAPDVPLIVFAGILLAVFLRGSGDWIADRLGIGHGWGLLIFCLLLGFASAAFFAFAGAAFASQFAQLWERLPGAIQAVRNYVQGHEWLQRFIQDLDLPSLLPSGSNALGTVSTTFGALANAVIVFFVGLYGAVNPGLYSRGAVLLVAPSLRPKASEILRQASVALRGWLRAQFISMSVIGVLTGLGLWFLGLPLVPVLAVLAALLTFIPNIGPVIAAVPAVLLGFSDGVDTALWVVGLYAAVQAIESYLVTPQVQQETVSLPPALTISFQFFFGLLFGILGLALATPFAAVVLRLAKRFYVGEYLDAERPAPVP